MKTLTKILTATAMIASLAACGAGSSSGDSNKQADECHAAYPELNNAVVAKAKIGNSAHEDGCLRVKSAGEEVLKATSIMASVMGDTSKFSADEIESAALDIKAMTVDYTNLNEDDKKEYLAMLEDVKAAVLNAGDEYNGVELINVLGVDSLVGDLNYETDTAPRVPGTEIQAKRFAIKKCLDAKCHTDTLAAALLAITAQRRNQYPYIDLQDMDVGSDLDLITNAPTFVDFASEYASGMVNLLKANLEKATGRTEFATTPEQIAEAQYIVDRSRAVTTYFGAAENRTAENVAKCSSASGGYRPHAETCVFE